MDEQPHLDLYDADLLCEIEMTTELMIAAAGAPNQLGDDIVNAILGLATSFPDEKSLPRQRSGSRPPLR